MKVLIAMALALLLMSCASNPRRTLADADDVLSAMITAAGILVNQGVIKEADKPQLQACFQVIEAAIAESRAQLSAGVDLSATKYVLVLQYIAVAQAFISNQQGDLNVCTN